jgi:hypothetical protein
MSENQTEVEVWTELPPENCKVLVTAYRTPHGWATTLASEAVKTRGELIEILEVALALAKSLRPGSGPNRT